MTDVTLKEHFEALLHEQDRRIEQAITNSKEAVVVAQVATNERLKLLNEFKNLAAEKDSTFATLTSVEALDKRISKLESTRDSLYSGIAILVVVGTGIFAVIKLFWST